MNLYVNGRNSSRNAVNIIFNNQISCKSVYMIWYMIFNNLIYLKSISILDFFSNLKLPLHFVFAALFLYNKLPSQGWVSVREKEMNIVTRWSGAIWFALCNATIVAYGTDQVRRRSHIVRLQFAEQSMAAAQLAMLMNCINSALYTAVSLVYDCYVYLQYSIV